MSKYEEQAGAARGRLFAGVYGAFALVHEVLDLHRWITDGAAAVVLGTATLLAAVPVVLRPGSTRGLALLAALWVAHVVNAMPAVPNHMLFTTLLNLTILGGLAWAAPSGRDPWAEFDRRVAPALRIALVILYGFAVLHKLNHDYFDPAVSCGTQLFRELETYLPFLPQGDVLDRPAIAGSLVIEALLGIGLVIGRTRVPTLVVGLLFHGLLIFHINYYVASFSSLVMALYVLFLPLGRVQRIMQRPPWPKRLRMGPGLVLVSVVLTAVCVVLAAALVRGMQGTVSYTAQVDGMMGPVVRGMVTLHVGGLVAMGLLVLLARGVDDRGRAELHMPARVFLLLPAMVLFNGLNPYLGLKTQTSFAVFSNLRTEMRRTNHLFMPVHFRLADHQDRLVQVLHSSHPALADEVESGDLVPFFKLRRVAAEDPAVDLSIVFRPWGADSAVVARRDAIAGPLAAEVFRAPPWWQRKLLLFRSVPPLEQPCTCRH